MRYPILDNDKMSAEQRQVLARVGDDNIVALPGSYAALAYAPVAASLVYELDKFLTTGLRIPERLRTVAMLTAASTHQAGDVQKFVDAKALQQNDLAQDTVDAITAGRHPISAHADENLVHEFVTELASTGRVSNACFDKACGAFGREVCLELVKICGFTIFINNLTNIAKPPAA